MVARRKLNIVLASPGKNVGMEESHADVKTIQYNGQAIDVRLDQ
jgi:hypothetical protein